MIELVGVRARFQEAGGRRQEGGHEEIGGGDSRKVPRLLSPISYLLTPNS